MLRWFVAVRWLVDGVSAVYVAAMLAEGKVRPHDISRATVAAPYCPIHAGINTKMSYKIHIEKNADNPPARIELLAIGGDVASPAFAGIGDCNMRLADAKALVSACAASIKNGVGLSVTPGIYFVYRGVAVGRLQRGLGGFSSKPLTVKNKSIDPGIIKDNADFARLTGLVPLQIKLGKKGRPDDTSSIPLSRNQASYRIVKIEDAGNAKSYLCCGTSNRNLSWEDAAIPTGKSLCTFLGDTTNPYLADWDLVLVGVTKVSIKNDSTLRCFKVTDAGGAGSHNLLPQWLADGLKNQKVPLISHVTQHGPESLYCGNDITQCRKRASRANQWRKISWLAECGAWGQFGL